MVVIVVPIELSLDGVSSQILRPFDEIRVFEIFPFLTDVLLIVVIIRGRDEGCSQLLLVKVLPRKVCEPWMIFDFLTPVVAESILGLPLYHLIDEVCGFYAPANRHFLLLDLDLFCQYIISNVFPRFPNVWPFTIHALISHNSHRKIVHGERMILSAHYLGSHVTRCA